jgi:hypothetical protein
VNAWPNVVRRVRIAETVKERRREPEAAEACTGAEVPERGKSK